MARSPAGLAQALMASPPEIRYARNGEVHLAYQVVGDSPLDLVFAPPMISHLEAIWDEPEWAGFYNRLASFSRLILFDKRGSGLSDPVPVRELPTLEERMGDMRSVMDAAGTERAALYGLADGGAVCMLFAAMHPERVSSLVLYGAAAKMVQGDGYPHGLRREQVEPFLDAIEQGWGSGVMGTFIMPERLTDASVRKRFARMERLSSSPAMAVAAQRMDLEVDIRHVLPSIHAPTLILSEEGRYSVGHCRYLAEHIAGARLVEFPPTQTFGNVATVDDVQEFLTGLRHAPEPERMLTTVLFTDIVGSTEHAVRLGDSQWRRLLDHHDVLAQDRVERFGGRVVKTSGDGMLATFDRPARAVQCACAIRDAVRGIGLQVRAGVHTGEVELRGEDIGGIGVHIAHRVQSQAAPGEVLVTRTVTELVAGSGIEFDDRGERDLKGVPNPWHVFAVV